MGSDEWSVASGQWPVVSKNCQLSDIPEDESEVRGGSSCRLEEPGET
ncbi:MAG: hypothetical protein AB1611_00870 [bacterium]